MVVINKIFILPILCEIAFGVNTDNLVALVQVFRHGQRSPFIVYSNDPYKSYWEEGKPGQLTYEGRRQIFELGHITRVRYSDWIPEEYNNSFLRVHTTETERTRMSLQAFILGLFPSNIHDTSLRNIDLGSIPLHSTDTRTVWGDVDCPTYALLIKKVWSSKDFVKITKKYEDLYKYLSEHSGDNINLKNGLTLYSCLKIENDIGLPLPEWTKSVFPGPLRYFSGLTFKSITYTAQLKRLGVGLFFKDILDYFDNMTESASFPKIQVYSAHDASIAAVLNSFGAFVYPYPPDFASTIWIELRNNSDSYYLNVWSKDGDDLNQIAIRGCVLDCPLEQVRASLAEIIIDYESWKAECKSSWSLNEIQPSSAHFWT